jgi:hypothetical protein
VKTAFCINHKHYPLSAELPSLIASNTPNTNAFESVVNSDKIYSALINALQPNFHNKSFPAIKKQVIACKLNLIATKQSCRLSAVWRINEYRKLPFCFYYFCH